MVVCLGVFVGEGGLGVLAGLPPPRRWGMFTAVSTTRKTARYRVLEFPGRGALITGSFRTPPGAEDTGKGKDLGRF